MRASIPDQRGMTFVGLMMMLVIVAVIAVLIIKILPLYVENFKVRSVLESMAQETRLADMTDKEIRESVLKRMGINDIEHVTENDIQMKKEGKTLVISIEYEARSPLLWNLDVVASFPDNVIRLDRH